MQMFQLPSSAKLDSGYSELNCCSVSRRRLSQLKFFLKKGITEQFKVNVYKKLWVEAPGELWAPLWEQRRQQQKQNDRARVTLTAAFNKEADTFCVRRSSELTSCWTTLRYLSAALTTEALIKKSQTGVVADRVRTRASGTESNLKNKKAESIIENSEVISCQRSVKPVEMCKIQVLGEGAC